MLAELNWHSLLRVYGFVTAKELQRIVDNAQFDIQRNSALRIWLIDNFYGVDVASCSYKATKATARAIG